MKNFLLLFCLAATTLLGADLVKLQLPPRIYAVPGVETSVYFDNIVLVVNPANYVFDVDCAKGRNDEDRWRFTPEAGDAGTYKWSVQVLNEGGVLAKAETELVVAPANAGTGKDIAVLLVGDSLTDHGVYAARIFEDFQRPDNPKLTMIGSNGPKYKPVPGGVAYEGWGGWTWNSFITRGVAPKVANPRPWDVESRFLVQKEGKFVLDFQNYFNRFSAGRVPDFITFQLGVNDIFSCRDENREERIAAILKDADVLIAAARQAAPNAVIGVGLVTPGARSQDAFGKNYTCGQTRWQYKKNQHALNQAMLEKFASYPDKKVVIIPTNVNVDCANNFPVVKEPMNLDNPLQATRQNNGVHPSAAGYRQIGDTFYAWMKYHLNQQPDK